MERGKGREIKKQLALQNKRRSLQSQLCPHPWRDAALKEAQRRGNVFKQLKEDCGSRAAGKFSRAECSDGTRALVPSDRRQSQATAPSQPAHLGCLNTSDQRISRLLEAVVDSAVPRGSAAMPAELAVVGSSKQASARITHMHLS